MLSGVSASLDKRVLWVFPLLALVECLLALRNLIILERPTNWIMASCQALLIVGLLAVWQRGRRHPLTVEAMGSTIFAVLLCLSGLVLLEQALTHQGLLAANLALLLTVGGALISPRRRFGVFAVLLVLGWLGVVLSHENWDIPVVQQGLLVALGLFVSSVVNILRDIDRKNLVQARDEAVNTAMRDPLTQLWNRRGVQAVLPSMIGGARSLNSGIWCAFIDVRGLKVVNDALGHAAGDDLLHAIGRVLLDREASGQVPARWGGDEFCLFGGGPTPEPGTLAQELRAQIADRTSVKGVWDVSCGVAFDSLDDADDVDRLVSRADKDMYRRRGEQAR
jgi:diguanylate cyclase (GGDEF)-like protein